MSQEELSFSLLEGRVKEHLREVEQKKPTRLERWSFMTGMVAAAVTVLLGALGNWHFKAVAMAIGLVLELAGLIIAAVCMGLREKRNLSFAFAGFAGELDHGFNGYRTVVTWLSTFSGELVGSRLRYVRDRKARFLYRFGLLVGSVERLGVLPLVIVLYLQFKDWTFGDWQALGHVHLVGGLLLWVLLLIYVGGWWLGALKERMDLYEMLLAEASASHCDGWTRREPTVATTQRHTQGIL